jgi:hypothetical protein
MDHRVNPENESKSIPVTRSFLSRGIMVVDSGGNIRYVPPGFLPEVWIVYTDQNGEELARERFW